MAAGTSYLAMSMLVVGGCMAYMP
jgi:hypothetical protein